MIKLLQSFLQSQNLNIRDHQENPRFIDQKVTPDVLCFVSDCVVNFVGGDSSKIFTNNDIWNSSYFKKNLPAIFGKPEADDSRAAHEYDKFIAQPLNALAYSGIVEIVSAGRPKQYKVKNLDLLEYISLKDSNAYNFLAEYLEKVLRDSSFFHNFVEYQRLYSENQLTNSDFKKLKEKFQEFLKGHTQINTEIECNRIFPKVINVLAVKYGLPGSISGNISEYPYVFSDLMYNERNWRDLKKAKSITRQEAKATTDQQEVHSDYLVAKAMEFIRKKYAESEVKDKWANVRADYVHHIFPRSEFAGLAMYLENLIKLTAYQHSNLAHPNGNTRVVNKDYQLVCILSKADSIENSLKSGEFIYSKESFLHVINTGLSSSLDMNLDFGSIKKEVAKIYNRS
jgi:hypothetical protein